MFLQQVSLQMIPKSLYKSSDLKSSSSAFRRGLNFTGMAKKKIKNKITPKVNKLKNYITKK